MNDMDYINLSGNWSLKLDPDQLGLVDCWYLNDLSKEEQILLPGSLNESGKGSVPTIDTLWTGSIYDRSWFHDPALEKYRKTTPPHFPFWLTPISYYVGVAWYQLEIVVKEEQSGNAFRLFLERPHWQTTVWIDSVLLGSLNSLSVAHVFEGSCLETGRHVITIRVDNRVGEINPGPDAHSITDHTQGNWNGIIGRMELQFLNRTNLADIKITPDQRSENVLVEFLIHSNSAIQGNLSIVISKRNDREHPVAQNCVCVNSQSIDYQARIDLFLPNPELWDEFSPHLYEINIQFISADGHICSENCCFGFRDYSVKGTQFTINGRSIFLRGNVDCCVFPLTGYPPTTIDLWMDVYRALLANGANHVRFHSWCPPEAAFDAADELGVYLQIEAPCWPNHGSSVGDGEPIDSYIYDETERIIHAYGNHPSFVMYAAGNEPYGKNQVHFLREFACYWRNEDPRRLYTGASVGTQWPIVSGTDFIVHSRPRGLPWDKRPHSMFHYTDEIADQSVPFVAHEMGQFCVFPDYGEIKDYQGVFRAKNLEMFRELFAEHFAPEKESIFLEASGRLQVLCYKAEIEASLRTPGFAGIQLLGLNDFPGQGTALIGIMNAFYRNKSYVESSEFRGFFDSTVPLTRFEKFVFNNDEVISVQLGVAHFGSNDILEPQIQWKLLNDAEVLFSGNIESSLIPTGKYTEWSKVSLSLGSVLKAQKLTFVLQVDEWINQWDLWVYPSNHNIRLPQGILIEKTLNEDVYEAIEKGRDILLLAGDSIENGKDVVQYFRPAFWNTSWFQMKPPHTLGLSIDNNHPVFKDFPTENFSNYQWWELVQEQPIVNLENFPTNFEPIVQPIDTWFLNRRLAMIFEMKIGNSRVFVCTADIVSDLGNRPVARQLYRSILNYLRSDEFRPSTTVDITVLQELFEVKQRAVLDVMTDEKPDELIPEVE